METKTPFDIDGSVLEGGGQILRMAIVFSGLLQRPVRIFNIRANRRKPGLAAQHLNGLLVARDICQGRLLNAQLGSTEIVFYPGTIKSGNFYADSQTAGSVTLIMQVALPLMMFASELSQLTVKGGTNADMAPPIDYYTNLWKPLFCHFFGLNINIYDKKRGFFPKGGGEIHVDVTPVQFVQPILLTEKGNITSIWGQSFVAGSVNTNVSSTMAKCAREFIVKHHQDLTPSMINIKTSKLSHEEAFGNGSGIYLYAETSTKARFSSGENGNPRVSPSDSGLMAATNLSKVLSDNGCTDEYTQDQIIVMMALARGRSSVLTGPISLHTKTAIYIAELMTDAKFSITENSDNSNSIECEGIGFINKNCSRKAIKNHPTE